MTENKNEQTKRSGIGNKRDLLEIIGAFNDAVALGAFNVLIGASLGYMGRTNGDNWLPVIPPAADIAFNGLEPFTTPRGILVYAQYGVGVALPYADIIYNLVQTKLPEISQTVQTLVDRL